MCNPILERISIIITMMDVEHTDQPLHAFICFRVASDIFFVGLFKSVEKVCRCQLALPRHLKDMKSSCCIGTPVSKKKNMLL